MAPATMRALVAKEPKTAEVKEIETPKPGEGEILIKVFTVAQNPTDWVHAHIDVRCSVTHSGRKQCGQCRPEVS